MKNLKAVKEVSEVDIVSSSEYFDEDYYLRENPDVASAGWPPVDHYCNYGWREGRKPSDRFDLLKYCVLKNIPVPNENPILMLEQGRLSGYVFPTKDEQLALNELKKVALFDSLYYRKTNPDVEKAGINPELHFVRCGWLEGRTPCSGLSYFDESRLSKASDFFEYLSVCVEIVRGKTLVERAESHDVKLVAPPVLENKLASEAVQECKQFDVLVVVKNYHLASSLWRGFFLAEAFRNNSVKCIVRSEIEAEEYIPKSSIVLFQKFTSADHRFIRLTSLARQNNCEIWGDIDDAFLPGMICHSGQAVSGMWSREQQEKLADGFMSVLDHIDLLLVSTGKIRDAISDLRPSLKVIVRKNRIPHRFFSRRKTHKKVVPSIKLIYPSGSLSHKADFELVAPEIEKFLKKFKDCTLTLLGGDFVEVPDYIKVRSNVRVLPRMRFEEMMLELEKHDVLLAPLISNPFNDAKSNIKFIEAASAKVLTMTTSVSEFSEVIEDGVNGILEDNADKWFDRLVDLRRNPDSIRLMAERAFETVASQCSVDFIEPEVLSSVREIVSKELDLRFPNKSHQKYPNWYLGKNSYYPLVGDAEMLHRINSYSEGRAARGKAKFVVYTCLTASYDSLKIPEYLDVDVDYICFSDQPVFGYGVWQVRPYNFKSPDSTRVSRHPKILPHLYLEEYDASIYIDANIVPRLSMLPYFHQLTRGEVRIAGIKHPWRDCIYQEADACKKSNKDNPDVINRLVEFLRSRGYPEKNGMFENNTIYRKHNDDSVKAAMEIWWDLYSRYSKRDQLSYMYAVNELDIKPSLLLGCKEKHVRNTSEFAYFSHSSDDVWRLSFIK